jgi:UDP-N-acetylmuramoyl-L-alanyl-D-glutamate--2,6-diaminopimelate ligase
VLLGKLLDGVAVSKLFMMLYGAMAQTQDLSVHAIAYDSRRVERGDLFVAIPGTSTNGQRFISEAIQRGAIAVVVDDDAATPDALFLHTRVAKVVVADARIALAQIAANFYDHPARQLQLIGVTGTNGKTTTTHLIKAALEAQGRCVGLIGTIQWDMGGEVMPATHTTPESLELNHLLHTMVQRGCDAAVMEVSSHALVQHRVHGLQFSAAVFTNLTQDHLDYHGSMDDYCKAKKMLFDGLHSDATAVVNANDPYGETMVSATKARVLRYGVDVTADINAMNIEMGFGGMKFGIAAGGLVTPVASTLTGRFNVANILAAYGAATAAGVPAAVAAKGIGSVRAVRGRFEQVLSPDGWMAIIDYAHTPDALENALRAIRDVVPSGTSGRVITLFGCGGNRDRTKRPIMGRIATQMSDVIIVTSDNPRTEDPAEIIREVCEGIVPGSQVHVEPDRRAAIALALSMARPGDVVLIAGKGHEDYQVVGTEKHHLDDREEVEAFLRRRT